MCVSGWEGRILLCSMGLNLNCQHVCTTERCKLELLGLVKWEYCDIFGLGFFSYYTVTCEELFSAYLSLGFVWEKKNAPEKKPNPKQQLGFLEPKLPRSSQ